VMLHCNEQSVRSCGCIVMLHCNEQSVRSSVFSYLWELSRLKSIKSCGLLR
jgi:hypothetical protein